MKMLRDDNKNMSARLAGLEDSLRLAAKEATPTIYAAVKRYLTPKGAVNPKVSVSIPTGNSVEGEYEVGVSTTTTYGQLDYSFRVPMKAGAPVITETNFFEAFDKAFEDQKTAPVDLSSTREAQNVNLSSIEAERQHDLVLYSSKELPEWSFIVTVDALKGQKNHAVIASQILASVRGHVLANSGKVAQFADTSFELPAVKATEIKAAAKPVELHEIPGFSNPKTAHEIQAEITERNLIVSGARSSEAPSELQAADESEMHFHNTVSREAYPVVEAFVRRSLKGDAPRIEGSDFTSLKRRADGSAHGKFLVLVSYFGEGGKVQSEIEVPFESGKLVATKVAKSAKTIEAEKVQAEELKVLSAEEAKARFEDFKARQATLAEDMMASGLAVSAADDGSNQNILKNNPANRIPVLKALLPPDVKSGSKILVGSFVYQVADTDYQSVSAEKSAYYMLCLTSDMPSQELPSLGIWGSLGGLL